LQVSSGGLSDQRSEVAHTGLSFLPRWLRSHFGSADRIEVLLLLDVRRITWMSRSGRWG